jgi:hypothetical protein
MSPNLSMFPTAFRQHKEDWGRRKHKRMHPQYANNRSVANVFDHLNVLSSISHLIGAHWQFHTQCSLRNLVVFNAGNWEEVCKMPSSGDSAIGACVLTSMFVYYRLQRHGGCGVHQHLNLVVANPPSVIVQSVRPCIPVLGWF